jgi:hypothetical protein
MRRIHLSYRSSRLAPHLRERLPFVDGDVIGLETLDQVLGSLGVA